MRKKMKKLALTIFTILSLGFMVVACENANIPNSDMANSETDIVDTSSASGDDDNSDENNPEDDPFYIWAGSIMDEAYLLPRGEYLSGTYQLSGTVTEIDIEYNNSICLYFDVYEPNNREMYCYKLKGSGIHDISVGDFITVSGKIKNHEGIIEFDKDCVLVSNDSGSGNITPDDPNDPYASVSFEQFYANYTPATSADDAYYRSLHGFMSGEIETPNQAPTISNYQPKNGNKFIRNSVMQLSEDGKTYTVVDAYGEPAFNVYKSGAYITLEEVAAYVYAFGTYPQNYTPSKDEDPSDSIWGEYLRLNHTSFSGDTGKYPYEPVLPNISGCGGSLRYYEMDIGTTGTDCDPSFPNELYNNGSTITRGAARIVYGKNDIDNDGVYEIGEFHVFYTYNHYNDFQEYLNYEGGWGEKFGNITGGGTISSKNDYNPTDYIPVSYEPLPNMTIKTTSVVYYNENKRRLDAYTSPIFCIV